MLLVNQKKEWKEQGIPYKNSNALILIQLAVFSLKLFATLIHHT